MRLLKFFCLAISIYHDFFLSSSIYLSFYPSFFYLLDPLSEEQLNLLYPGGVGDLKKEAEAGEAGERRERRKNFTEAQAKLLMGRTRLHLCIISIFLSIYLSMYLIPSESFKVVDIIFSRV